MTNLVDRFPRGKWFFHQVRKIPLTVILVVCLSMLAFWDLAGIPFHPDETSNIYRSRDFKLLFHQPWLMAWDPASEGQPDQSYRELDPPFSRYWIGAANWLAGVPDLEADWDWTINWETNQQAGAVPNSIQLITARFATTILFPASLILIYIYARRMVNHRLGVLAILAFGLNSLVLLHARRAMTEGPLLFGELLALVAFLGGRRYPWLAGLAAAVAVNAKHTAIALLPVGMVAVLWITRDQLNWKRICLQIFQFGLAFGVLSLALNPLWWSNPVQAVIETWEARQELASAQVQDSLAFNPNQVLDSGGERMAGLLANLFLVPPAFAEASNYSAYTALAEAAYQQNPVYGLFRTPAWGVIMLSLALFGLFSSLLVLRTRGIFLSKAILLLLVATAAQLALHLVSVPLSWQRYVMPFIPSVALWQALGLEILVGATWKSIRKIYHRTAKQKKSQAAML